MKKNSKARHVPTLNHEQELVVAQLPQHLQQRARRFFEMTNLFFVDGELLEPEVWSHYLMVTSDFMQILIQEVIKNKEAWSHYLMVTRDFMQILIQEVIKNKRDSDLNV